MILAITLAFVSTTFEIDFSQLAPADAMIALRALPAGSGEIVRLQGFDGTQVMQSVDQGREFAAKLGQLADEAHARGYRVLADWSALEWKGVSKTKERDQLLEFRATNAFARKPDVEFVSPSSPSVRKCLLGYVSSLKTVAPKLDVLVIRYAHPRQPIFAYGSKLEINTSIRKIWIR